MKHISVLVTQGSCQLILQAIINEILIVERSCSFITISKIADRLPMPVKVNTLLNFQ